MNKSAIAAAIVAASLLPAGAARAQSPTGPASTPSPAIHAIRPAQFFDGLVNDVAHESTIRMVCPSVTRPGQTGHPAPGQSVSVHQLFPPSAATGLGFTGGASTISATLRVVSPSATTAFAPIPLAVFSLYDRPVAIPTTLTLPCGGAGAVVFDPVQGGATAEPFTTKVTFVSITPVSG